MKTQEEVAQQNKSTFNLLFKKAAGLIMATFGALEPNMVSTEKWHDFRTFLLHSEELDHMRADKDFKWGVQLVIQIIEALTKVQSREETETFKTLADDLILDLTLGDDADHKAVLKLIETLDILKKETNKYSIYLEHFLELQIDLDTISRCQWIAMEAAKYRPK